jgi:hypothetical protein
MVPQLSVRYQQSSATRERTNLERGFIVAPVNAEWPGIPYTWPPAGLGMQSKSAYHRLRTRCHVVYILRADSKRRSVCHYRAAPSQSSQIVCFPRQDFLDQPLGQLPIPSPPTAKTPIQGPRRRLVQCTSRSAMCGVMAKAPRRVVKRFRCK